VICICGESSFCRPGERLPVKDSCRRFLQEKRERQNQAEPGLSFPKGLGVRGRGAAFGGPTPSFFLFSRSFVLLFRCFGPTQQLTAARTSRWSAAASVSRKGRFFSLFPVVLCLNGSRLPGPPAFFSRIIRRARRSSPASLQDTSCLPLLICAAGPFPIFLVKRPPHSSLLHFGSSFLLLPYISNGAHRLVLVSSCSFFRPSSLRHEGKRWSPCQQPRQRS